MIAKLKNFLFSKKPYLRRFPIHVFEPYFAVKGVSPYEITSILNLQNLEIVNAKIAFDFLRQNHAERKQIDNPNIRIIISAGIQDWVFIYWENGIFEDCKTIVEKLIEKSNDKVNYYYVDSNVDGYDWILADRGKIYREFEYNMNEISSNFGNPITNLENEFITNVELNETGKQNEFVFGENVFQSILEKNGLSKLKYHDNDSEFLIGIVQM